MAMIFLDPDHAVSCMRRNGVLRASRYGYRGSLIGRVAKAVLGAPDVFEISPDRIVYLESVKVLSCLAGNAQTLREQIEATVRARRSTVLKTVFVLVNNLFYDGWINDHDASSLDSRRYSSEEYAEAASFILHIYASMFPVDGMSFAHVDTDAAGKNSLVYERLLVAAIRLAKFREAEQLIDGLPYRADREGGEVTISSIDPDVERAVRLGFIQQRTQAFIRQFFLQEADQLISIRTLIDTGFDRGSFDNLLEIKEHPVRRFVLLMPAIPVIFDAWFANDELFRDEIQMLMELDVDHFGTFDDLIFPITDRISSLDVLKAQRYFNFISCAYQRRLADIQDPVEREELTLTSTLLAISHDAMVEQMQLILGDEDKACELIELLKMVPEDGHLDLQYRPFVDVGGYYMIAPHVVAASNLVRNTIVANRLRSAAIGRTDLMVQSVTEALRSAGFEVESDLKAKIAGQKLELDIVARRDDALVLLECKNAYHPVSVHEMRNSWEHIRNAAMQLDKRQDILVDLSNQSQLFNRLDWKVSSKCTVHTGIVIANRVFHGASLNGHPIRQAHELINVLNSGRIAVRNGPKEESLSFWLEPDFQTADLTRYLGPKSIASDQLAVLDARSWRYSIGSRELAFSSYVLDMVKFDKEMRERYKS
jgi:BMFP domain-containing protein YqiC